MKTMHMGRVFVLWFLAFCFLTITICPTAEATEDDGLLAASYDYKDALSKAILFFEGQRSGKLPASQRVKWRGESGLSDGKLENVGDANADHQCWERPEDMDTPRTLYKITPNSPESEVAAEAAAALAAASIAFKEFDSKYSTVLLRRSELLFQFANKYRGSYSGSCPFYCSYSGYQDELLWAAAWLYKATGKDSYMNFVLSNEGWSQVVPEFSWDNKFAGAQILLAKEFLKGKTNLARFKNDADSFVCALMPGSSSVQIRTTPGTNFL